MVSVILVLALLISAGISSVEASDYLGELCWSFHKTEDENGPTDETFLARLGVNYTGGSNYILQGIVDIPDDNPFIFNGTAVIIGNEIFTNLNGSQEHSTNPYRDTGILQMRLDATTLSGTFWQNRLDFNISTRKFDNCYGAGTVTLTTCP